MGKTLADNKNSGKSKKRHSAKFSSNSFDQFSKSDGDLAHYSQASKFSAANAIEGPKNDQLVKNSDLNRSENLLSKLKFRANSKKINLSKSVIKSVEGDNSITFFENFQKFKSPIDDQSVEELSTVDKQSFSKIKNTLKSVIICVFLDFKRYLKIRIN
ncbi:MAG: hypothetical protein MHPSP_003268, partial [Paramarteilia canceri]